MTAGELGKELRIVNDLARVVAAGPYDVDEIVERVCGEIRTAFGFERALLVRYDPAARTVFAVVQQGVEWPGEEWLLLDKFPFLVRALETGRAVYVTDAGREAALPTKIAERFRVGSIVATPLNVEGDCLGFLVGDRRRGGGRFDLSEHELAFLTTLGAVAAVFIRKAEQYAELQRALEDVERLDRARNEFVSVASHELRTPIAAAHGIATVLRERSGELSDRQRDELSKGLHRTTSRLLELVEQLLDLSRLESGRHTTEPATFALRPSLEAIVAASVPDRAGEIELDVPEAAELTCDRYAFERVVSNVVANACRYGRPPVKLRAEQEDCTRIVVEDRGRGVDPSFAPRLFERFARSETSAGVEGGTGLGLAIARSFARALGGDLTYEAAEPTGARFTFVLPAYAGSST